MVTSDRWWALPRLSSGNYVQHAGRFTQQLRDAKINVPHPVAAVADKTP
jgi:hypothetical protein